MSKQNKKKSVLWRIIIQVEKKLKKQIYATTYQSIESIIISNFCGNNYHVEWVLRDIKRYWHGE